MAIIHLLSWCLFALTTFATSPSWLNDTEASGGNEQRSNNHVERRARARPFYAIAHRVLTLRGLDDALAQGANAVEIDVTSWPTGWWADHDSTGRSARETLERMFQVAAGRRREGKNLAFIWLDIKSPNKCNPWDPKVNHCSIVGLQEMARRLLQPAGIRVLYGFYGSAAFGVGFDYIRGRLNHNEALNLNGGSGEIIGRFKSSNFHNVRQRVLSYGSNELPKEFGTCYEPTYKTCTELRQAVNSRQFGKVFGWTVTANQWTYAGRLMNDAHVDGVIYGPANSDFYNTDITRTAFRDVRDWVNKKRDSRYMASARDAPW
ncbi:phospholipase D [Pochonia chlamydosporia 170]|uniref:Phospholipase D n=1 Tax=Pochonia chlamydosporia 170 TaxID=1380566 RepID=A0A179EZE6_METCM|nr:phospholipase D [Pochonia chlamydosporia 170]OAQ58551.1 phospholipase D [Pochonia chlamydosporia 170]